MQLCYPHTSLVGQPPHLASLCFQMGCCCYNSTPSQHVPEDSKQHPLLPVQAARYCKGLPYIRNRSPYT